MARGRAAGRGLPAGAEGRAARLPAGRPRGGGLRRRVAGPEDVERRRHPGPRRHSGADPPHAARRSRRHPGPLHRGGGRRRPHRLALPAERESPTRAQVRRQARLVRALDRPCGGADGGGCAGRPGRRLQRRPDRSGHLPRAPRAGERSAAPAEPRGVWATAGPRDGPTRCGGSGPRVRSGPSGPTFASAGPTTRACGSTISFSARTWPIGWSTAGSVA